MLSREAVLNRFTPFSSFDRLPPWVVSIEEVGVRVLEEELELEVEKRLKGRRSGLDFLRLDSGGAGLWLSRIEFEGDKIIGEEPTDEPGESRKSEAELALNEDEELLRSSEGMSG